MSRQATMLRAGHTAQRGAPRRPEPAIPWVMHRFNPSVPPAEPIKLKGDPDNLSGAAPVMWHNQCRDCFGWVDDPRHS